MRRLMRLALLNKRESCVVASVKQKGQKTKMNSALFTYGRPVSTTVNGVVTKEINTNFVNPQNVISFFWQKNEEGNQVLSVFLANNYTLTFHENLGKRFVDHMEDFLRLLLGEGRAVVQQSNNNRAQHREGPRTARRAMEAVEVLEDVPLATDAQWVGN